MSYENRRWRDLIGTRRQHPDIQVLYSVPHASKLMANHDEGTSILVHLDIVIAGGSVCPKAVGENSLVLYSYSSHILVPQRPAN